MKSLLKSLVHFAAVVAVSPLLFTYWLGSLLLGKPRALEGATQTLALLPGLTGITLRRAFLCQVLAKCDRSVEVGFGTLFSQPGAILEANVYIGPRCHLGLVHLEKDVLLAAGVHVPSGGKTHFFDDPDTPIRDQGGERTVVRIGAGAWVGSAAIVLADVGDGTVVAAGAVVTKPLPPMVIAGGVPAKVIRDRVKPA